MALSSFSSSPSLTSCRLLGQRKSYSLSPKIYLDEDLTQSQVAKLKQACALVVAAQQEGKYAVIRNLKVVICDTFPTGWVLRAASKAKWRAQWQLSIGSLCLNCWNSNGILWSMLGLLNDVIGSTKLLFITETHESPMCPLPIIFWLSVDLFF